MADLRMFGHEIKDFKTKDENGTHKYTVEHIYQCHVQCRNEKGQVECFNMGDLVRMGVLASGNERYGNPYNKFD